MQDEERAEALDFSKLQFHQVYCSLCIRGDHFLSLRWHSENDHLYHARAAASPSVQRSLDLQMIYYHYSITAAAGSAADFSSNFSSRRRPVTFPLFNQWLV